MARVRSEDRPDAEVARFVQEPPSLDGRRGARRAVRVRGVGLSHTAFAAREGLDVQRLRWWGKKVGAVATPAFVEVRPRTIERTVDVVLQSGLVLRVAESIEATALRRLIGALEFPSPC